MQTEKTKKIILFITDAGGGHRASAASLKAAAEALKLPWDVRIVNIYREVWNHSEPLKKAFGFYAEDTYNFVLKNNLQIWTGLMRKAARFSASLPQRAARKALADFLALEKPHLCVSLIPFVNDVLADCHQEAGVPLGLVCTDLMDVKPFMWYTPRLCAGARFVSAPSPGAAEQAAGAGAGKRIVKSGLLIHRKYFSRENRMLGPAMARLRFELDEELYTVAILMGGYGSKLIEEFVMRLERSRSRLQVVACYGKNEALGLRLEKMRPKLKNKLVPLGFSGQLPALMRASDLLVSKPGPAALMEGLAMNVPMVLDDVDTLPQERPNVAWAVEQGVAIGLKRRKDILAVVERFMMDPSLATAMRERQSQNMPMDAAWPLLEAMESCLSNSTAS